mmetsp:Transcript_2595/g.8080  ORF Transcript_2595/g.8080 Transcript_2595/m.8080 type:complete len:261 (-) Transcript_2595:1637-2419(-)
MRATAAGTPTSSTSSPSATRVTSSAEDPSPPATPASTPCASRRPAATRSPSKTASSRATPRGRWAGATSDRSPLAARPRHAVSPSATASPTARAPARPTTATPSAPTTSSRTHSRCTRTAPMAGGPMRPSKTTKAPSAGRSGLRVVEAKTGSASHPTLATPSGSTAPAIRQPLGLSVARLGTTTAPSCFPTRRRTWPATSAFSRFPRTPAPAAPPTTSVRRPGSSPRLHHRAREPTAKTDINSSRRGFTIRGVTVGMAPC